MSKPGAALAHADGDARTRVRWSSRRPLRRIAAILTSLALGAGLALVGVAAPASAHTGDLKATAVCNTATGEYDVTYTLKLSNVPNGKTGTTKWRVGTSKFDGTPTSATAMDRGPISTTGNVTITLGTERLAGTTKGNGPWVYAFTTWNGSSKGSDGRIEGLSGDCAVPETPENVCGPLDTGHLSAGTKKSLLITAPAGKLIAEVCVKAGSIKQGDGPEYTTVTPPSKTYTISHSSGKDISHYSVRYVTAPKSVAIPAKPAKIDECGISGDSIAAQAQIEGVTWNIGPVVDGKATATATTASGYVFTDGTTSKTWDYTFTNEPCPIAAPVAPTFTEQCGLAGDAVVLPAAVEQVNWNVVGDPTTGGLVTVTAVADAGYAFPADAKTVFTHTFTDEPCPPTIIPIIGEPTANDLCGPDGDEVVVPPATEHMKWVVTGDPKLGGEVTVTAVADEGFAFTKDAKTTFTFTFDSAPCPIVVEVPAAPSSVDVCGTDDDGVNLPDDSDQITWTSEGDASTGKVTVTATAADGFVFPGEKRTQSFDFEFTNVECVEPSLKGSVATGICEADSPWIFFNVALTDPDKQSTGNTASLVLTDGTNTHTIELGELDGGTLTGKALWPGAAVDENGVATGWPGWAKVGNQWIEVDDNFAWTRGDIDAKIVVNPETAVTISYPEATPLCATGPKGSGGGASTPAASNGTGLASTGFAGTTIAIVAGIIVIAGLAFLVIARIRRKRA